MVRLTIPMNPLPHDDVLLLVLHVLKRVGESSDLPLNGSCLTVVGDVDHSVDVEPDSPKEVSSEGSQSGSKEGGRKEEGVELASSELIASAPSFELLRAGWLLLHSHATPTERKYSRYRLRTNCAHLVGEAVLVPSVDG